MLLLLPSEPEEEENRSAEMILDVFFRWLIAVAVITGSFSPASCSCLPFDAILGSGLGCLAGVAA